MTREELKHITDLCFTIPMAIRRSGEKKTYHAEEIAEAKRTVMELLEQEPKTEWIPVSERLPIIETDVLLTSWSGKQQFVGWIDAYGKWQADDGEIIDGYEPVAWMSLPEPFKESEGGDDSRGN